MSTYLDTPEHAAYRATMLAYGTPAQARTHDTVSHLRDMIDDLSEEVEAYRELVQSISQDVA